MIARAIAVATFWAAAVCFIVSTCYYIVPAIEPSDRLTDVFQFTLFVGGIASAVSIIATPVLFTLIGVPLYELSKRRGWTSAFHYVASSLVVTIILCTILIYLNTSLRMLQPKDAELAVINMLIAGPSSALVFWKVVKPQLNRA